jgi:hypothetical protein
MKSDLTITPKGDTINILEGKALEPKHPDRLVISGQIESVNAYLTARKGTQQQSGALQYVDKDLAVITIDEEAMTIHLDVDPNNPFGTEVTGKLYSNPELAAFVINKPGHRFTRESLLEVITFRRRFFTDVSQYDGVRSALQRLKISATSSTEVGSDNRGNKDSAIKKVVDSAGIPQNFKLTIPIYKGQPAKTFLVDLCLDYTDAGVRFYLESVELVELADADKKAIIQAQLKDFFDFCIIWK